MTPSAHIDVLIPTYNSNPAHLREALESLKNQTFSDWKAFIHDDCSSVDVRAIVEPFLADSRFQFKKSEKRLGIGGNWNACIAHTSAPIVTFLFQDDIWSPTYLEQAVNVLHANPSVGFVSMEHEYQFDNGSPDTGCYTEVADAKKDLSAGLHGGMEMFHWWLKRELHPNVIGEPSFVVMRRDVLKKAGPFLEDMQQCLDMEMWIRMLLISDWYDERSASFGIFRVHANAASARNRLEGHGLFDRLRCFEIVIGLLRGDDRKIAMKHRDLAIRTMIGKFFARRKEGLTMKGGSGNGKFKKFCLRHPLLILRAILTYFFSSK